MPGARFRYSTDNSLFPLPKVLFDVLSKNLANGRFGQLVPKFNVLGAFVLGTFIVLSEQWHLDGRYSLFAAVGFCGSLTTMSAFALDSSNLLESSHYGTLAINIVANIGLSIAALIGGKSLMSAIINN